MGHPVKVLARSMVIDHVNHEVYVDGVSLPWHLGVDGPQVESFDSAVLTVSIPVLVDGIVEIVTSDRRHIVDTALGDVGEWARRHVREGILAAYPDLILP